MRKRFFQGFTLIELLIVVAIIAILAAIATPNFLESQTRAKVARVRSDLRSVVTAIEAYRVDINKYPPCTPDLQGTPALTNLTTPIAYIVGIHLRDPYFGLSDGVISPMYGYICRDMTTIVDASNLNAPLWYMVTSNGPNTKLDEYRTSLDANDTVGFFATVYDPTNGVVGPGNIYRAGGQIAGQGAEAAHRLVGSGK